MTFAQFKEQYKQLNSKQEREKFIQFRILELIESASNKEIGKEHCLEQERIYKCNSYLYDCYK